MSILKDMSNCLVTKSLFERFLLQHLPKISKQIFIYFVTLLSELPATTLLQTRKITKLGFVCTVANMCVTS